MGFYDTLHSGGGTLGTMSSNLPMKCREDQSAENDPLKHDEPIETLYCALLFLLTRRAYASPPGLATMVTEHLKWLADHPDAEALPMLRETCRRLAMQWQSRSGIAVTLH